MKVLLGTKNKHKIIEMTRIIKERNVHLEVLSLNDFDDMPEPIEDGTSFCENAIIKAKYYYDIFKIPTITDDSGISARALNGEPGIYSARYASTTDENSTDLDNRLKLLKNLANYDDRYVYYTCAIAFYDGTNTYTKEGYTDGMLLEEEIGTNGFGYDCIFYSLELNKPLGIASDEEKDTISHRAKALNKLLDLLESQISTKM